MPPISLFLPLPPLPPPLSLLPIPTPAPYSPSAPQADNTLASLADDFLQLAAKIFSRPNRRGMLPVGAYLYRIHPARMRMLWEVSRQEGATDRLRRKA